MPLYPYKCSSCDAGFEASAPRQDYQKPQACPTCGTASDRVVGLIGFVLKGDGWVGKNQRIKGEMAVKNSRLDIKSRERSHDAPGLRLAPNVDGERVDSWDEAKKLATSKGKEATTYDTHIRMGR